jgi:hypothetical protein
MEQAPARVAGVLRAVYSVVPARVAAAFPCSGGVRGFASVFQVIAGAVWTLLSCVRFLYASPLRKPVASIGQAEGNAHFLLVSCEIK